MDLSSPSMLRMNLNDQLRSYSGQPLVPFWEERSCRIEQFTGEPPTDARDKSLNMPICSPYHAFWCEQGKIVPEVENSNKPQSRDVEWSEAERKSPLRG